MANTYIPGELVFDLYKIRQILYFRRKQIAIIYIIMILASLIYSLFSPKIYESKANILININKNTNIKEFNPYHSDKEMLYAASKKNPTTKFINNEIQILKSSKVLEPVIKKNNILSKNNQFITPEKLINSNQLIVENVKDSDVVAIRYIDISPEKAQSFINDFLASYVLISNSLYLEKTKNDLRFLEKHIKKIHDSINKKIVNLNSSDVHTLLKTPVNLDLIGSIDSNYSIYKQDVIQKYFNYKKYRKELEQELSNLARLQSNLKNSKIIEDYSKKSKKFTILSGPTLSEKNNYIEPNLVVNIILGLISAFFISLGYIIFSEITSKKLPLSDFYSFKKIVKLNDFYKISNLLILKQDYLSNASIISLVEPNTKTRMLNKLNLILNERVTIDANTCHFDNKVIESTNLKKILEYIKCSSHIIFFIKINKTNRELYKILKQHIKVLKKTIILELID